LRRIANNRNLTAFSEIRALISSSGQQLPSFFSAHGNLTLLPGMPFGPTKMREVTALNHYNQLPKNDAAWHGR